MFELTGLEPSALGYLMLVTLLAAIVRGYSGFGFSALVVMMGSWTLTPSQIVPVVLMLEIIASIHLLPSIWTTIDWGRLKRILIGSAFSIPIGVYILAYLDSEWTRILISVLVLLASALLLRGVSFQRFDGKSFDYSVGLVSGVMTGIAAIGGLAIATAFLSIQLPVAIMRSTLVAVFFATDIYSTGLGLSHGLLKQQTFMLVVFLFPLLVMGVIIGKRRFVNTSVALFRRLTIILLIFLATGGLIKGLIAVGTR
jgi:uncharacterized protein